MPRNDHAPDDFEPNPPARGADRDGELDPDADGIGRAQPVRDGHSDLGDRSDDDDDDDDGDLPIGRAHPPVYEDEDDGDGDLDRPAQDRSRASKRDDRDEFGGDDRVEELDLDELEAYGDFGSYHDELGPYDHVNPYDDLRLAEGPDA